MAEPTSTYSYGDLARIISRFLGYGYDLTTLSAEKTVDIDDIIQAGLNQFYFPPPLEQGRPPHRWSFLAPTYTLATVANDAAYDLPDNYGGMIGQDLTYGADESYHTVTIIPEPLLRRHQQGSTATGRPQYAAVRPKSHDATTGQRYEILFWPTPDAIYNLSFAYNVMLDKLSSANMYPLGGSVHKESILESCLKVAESRFEDNPGIHANLFLERLAASIGYDRASGHTVEYFGYAGDNSEGKDWGVDNRQLTPAEYDGTVWGE